MKNGLRRPKLKHKDYDFIRSFGAATVPSFPPEYDTDVSNYGFPDQNADGQPFACTNYTQAALATDLTGIRRNPADLEAITHANQRGGYDIRDSLDAARKLGWFKWYFNIQAYAPLDYFDAIRYAQLIGAPEARSVTVGTPWFPSWEAAIQRGEKTLPMPLPEELVAISRNSNAYGWHNWEVTGWASFNGIPMLKGKSWQGPIRDPFYIPREVVNVVMALKYTVAYTPTMLDAPNRVRISLPLLEWLKSFIRNLPLSWRY